MSPIRQRRTPEPAIEPSEEPAGSTGNSKVLVWAMVGFLVLGFVCLGLAFFLIDEPDSRFRIAWLSLDITFGRLMGLSTIFMAMSVMMKGVIQLFRRY
jgi:hypothetical protein